MTSISSKNFDPESKTVTFTQVLYQCRKVKKKFFFYFLFSERRSRCSRLLDTLLSSLPEFLGEPRCGGTPGEGTPSMLGDMDVPPFWPPFLTFWGLNSIFLGYFSHPPTPKRSFGVLKLPILTEFDLLGPKFRFSRSLFGSKFQRPAAHPHQFSDRVPPPPPPLPGRDHRRKPLKIIDRQRWQ